MDGTNPASLSPQENVVAPSSLACGDYDGTDIRLVVGTKGLKCCFPEIIRKEQCLCVP